MRQVLRETKTGRIVNVGDTITDFRGDTAKLEYWREGHRKLCAGGREFFITVYGLEVIDDPSELAGLPNSLTGETS